MVTNSNLSLVAPVARFDDGSFENEVCLIRKWFLNLLQVVDNPVVCSAFCFGSSLATSVVTSYYSGGWSLLTFPSGCPLLLTFIIRHFPGLAAVSLSLVV